jgi:hypothetical protein
MKPRVQSQYQPESHSQCCVDFSYAWATTLSLRVDHNTISCPEIIPQNVLYSWAAYPILKLFTVVSAISGGSPSNVGSRKATP